MKLGWNQGTCMNNSTLEQDLKFCEKYGYDYIEIRLDMLQDYLKTHTFEDLNSFFDNNNLKPYAINSIENINFRTPAEWEELIKLFEFACSAAQKIGNPYLIVVPTESPEMKDKPWNDIFDDSIEVLAKLAEIAKPYGVKLAYEPIGNPLWCVGSLQQALDIVEKVNLPHVGLALDAFNLYMYDNLKDIDTIDKVPLEKLFVYHIDDSEDRPLNELQQSHRLFPGDGVIPLIEISEKLHKLGYNEICSVELFRPEYWEMQAEDVFRIAAEKTKPYL